MVFNPSSFPFQISHVVLYDIPDSSEEYLHRGGRAGRLGRDGSICTLVADKEEFVLVRLANALKIDLERIGRLSSKKTKKRRRRVEEEEEEKEERQEDAADREE